MKMFETSATEELNGQLGSVAAFASTERALGFL
jgi:hypothetical protein